MTSGTIRLMVELLYGSGLRLNECLGLRVKDVDLDRKSVHVIPDTPIIAPRSIQISAIDGTSLLDKYGYRYGYTTTQDQP